MIYAAVVADDITGANDIGVMYSGNKLVTHVYTNDREVFLDCDVVIVDTDSRFDDRQMAYNKVFNATKRLMQYNPKQFFNKQCSVFRGNIGAEFDAMLDATGETFAPLLIT